MKSPSTMTVSRDRFDGTEIDTDHSACYRLEDSGYYVQDPAHQQLVDEIKSVTRLCSVSIERLISSNQRVPAGFAEFLEDLANTYQDFSERVGERLVGDALHSDSV